RVPAVLAIRAPLPRRVRVVLVAASVALPLIAWLGLGAAGVVDQRFLPTPGDVWAAGLELARSGQLAADTWATVQRVVAGFGLAVLVSVPLGIAMGSF